MKIRPLSYLFSTIILLGLVSGGSAGLSAQARLTVHAEPWNTLDRLLEPIVLDDVTAFNNVPTDELCAYHYTGSDWEQIPFQIDEKNESGAYVTVEDGVLDSNDEIVVMASDLGSLAGTSVTMLPGIVAPAYRVEVANPLNQSAKGWFYLVRFTSGECNSGRDYAAYDTLNLRLDAQNYSVGWGANFSGFDRFFLFNGPDILDRTKIYARYAGILTINEESQSLVQPVELVKDGPVRVIVKRGSGLTFGYASLLVNTTPVPLNLLPSGINVNEVRVSFDLAPGVTGTYYNENVPNGVSIDGVQDTVPTMLTKAWRQVSLESGTIVEVADLGQVSGTRQHFYKDASNCGNADTGDKQCWADSGYSILNPAKEPFTVVGTRYILPGSEPNLGETYFNYVANPLTTLITEDVIVTDTVYLPMVVK